MNTDQMGSKAWICKCSIALQIGSHACDSLNMIMLKELNILVFFCVCDKMDQQI